MGTVFTLPVYINGDKNLEILPLIIADDNLYEKFHTTQYVPGPFSTLNDAMQKIDELFYPYTWYASKYIYDYHTLNPLAQQRQEPFDNIFPNSYEYINLENTNNVTDSEGNILPSSSISKFSFNRITNSDTYSAYVLNNFPYFTAAFGYNNNPTYQTIGTVMILKSDCIENGVFVKGTSTDLLYVVVNIGRNYTANFFTGYTVILSSNYPPIAQYYSSAFDFWNGKKVNIPPNPDNPTNDPLNPGGISTGGIGGGGNFDDESIPVAIPGLPQLSATDTGFITLFNPSLSQLKSLSSYMWSDLFDLDGWKKIFADPMQAILGLAIVPVNVPSAGSTTVKVGNLDTGVTMNLASQQYVAVDCGTLNVAEYWGAYLDYSPFTKIEIYLPYIGTHALDVDDIMNATLHVVYHVDILSGACCAYIAVNDSVMYTFIGQVASSVPISGDSFTNVINGVLSIAGSIGSMVATGGASSPSAVTSLASTAVNALKPQIEKSGAVSGTAGLLGIQTPYLIITRPRQALAGSQNAFIGYPSYVTSILNELSGFTKVYEIHLENVPATDEELSEIEAILKGGVII